jgi:pimeloyl-ACP methyl ester carboxylesterase
MLTCGISGPVAVHTALRYPTRVAKLVLFHGYVGGAGDGGVPGVDASRGSPDLVPIFGFALSRVGLIPTAIKRETTSKTSSPRR